MLKALFQRLIKCKNSISRSAVGVRALVIKPPHILLIKHTYGPGDWYTVGGGVDAGESPLTALKRELKEEVGISVTQAPHLIGFFYNTFSDDYVALYLCEHFNEVPEERDHLEVAEKRWFLLTDLPPDISPATRRRIEEYLGMRVAGDVW